MLSSLGFLLTCLGVVALLAVPLAAVSDYIAHVVYGADQ
jgi:hypothetical protein